jgi:hypothetical protein
VLLEGGDVQALRNGACGRESIKLKFRPLVFVTDVHSDIGRGRTLSNSVTPPACPQAELWRQRVGNRSESQKCHSETVAKAVISEGVKGRQRSLGSGLEFLAACR